MLAMIRAQALTTSTNTDLIRTLVTLVVDIVPVDWRSLSQRWWTGKSQWCRDTIHEMEIRLTARPYR